MEADETGGGAAEGRLSASHGGARERIGARLGAARVAAGIELVDIARETRVPLRHLRAIEADAHDDLPALPYSVGFVKSFARAVGLDGDEAGTQFRAETSKVAHVPVAASLEPLDERRLPSRGLVAASVAALVLLVGGLSAYGAGWFDTVPATPVAEAPAVLAAEPVAEPAIVETDAPSTDGMTPASNAAPSFPAADPVVVPAATGTVSITALEDAWVRITAFSPETGKIVSVRTGLMAKGERYDLPATPAGQRLWTGRAGALRLSVNGRTLPPLGGAVETVKNISLAPADLLARLAPATPATGVR